MSAHQEEAAGSYRRLLRLPVLRGLALADVCARLPQGMVTVTLLLVAAVHAPMATAGFVVTGYVRLHHALWAAGPLLAELSVGSIAGSLLFGARGSADGRRLPRLLACYALGLAALAGDVLSGDVLSGDGAGRPVLALAGLAAVAAAAAGAAALAGPGRARQSRAGPAHGAAL